MQTTLTGEGRLLLGDACVCPRAEKNNKAISNPQMAGGDDENRQGNGRGLTTQELW